MAGSLPLERLLKPRSVVIVGASDKPGSLGGSVLGNLERFGFSGDIHLINPKRETIGTRPCLKSVADLPPGVDAAVLAIPRVGVLPAVRDLAARGVGAAVIFSAGFAEGGEEGKGEQAELARIAHEAGMVIEGPNCLGLINFVDGVPLTFIETAPAPTGDGKGVGIVSQSGAIAAVVDTVLLSRGLSLTISVSTGNEAGSGVEDYVEYLIDDPQTHVIGMVVEQFRKPQRFLEAARRAEAAGKPIVLLHPGTSSAARESAATHTGAMAGDYQVMKAKVERAGVILVETLEEYGDCLEILARSARPIGGGGTIVVNESGAYKAMTLDFAEKIGLELPPVNDEDSPALRAALPAFVPVSNPTDITAQGLAEPEIYGKVVEAVADDPRFGTVIINLIQTDPVTSGIKFPGITESLKTLKPTKPVLIAGVDEGAEVPADYIAQLREIGVPYFPTTERTYRAVARLAAHARRDRDASAAAPTPLSERPKGMIPEHRAKDLLRPLGLPFPNSKLATTLDEAKAAAAALGYPVVLKAQAADLPHKSDAGGVVVGLADEAALAAGWEKLQTAIRTNRPDLTLDGVLVEAMGARGTELIVGARNDPEWGAVILVGFGGVQAEILHDARLLTPDLTREGIKAELLKLKMAALLTGFRGAPPVDLDAVAGVVEALARLLVAEPSIREIDLNPVVVYPQGEGAVALDALILAD